MPDIFVSYKREDRDAVAHLVETLRKRGFSVWWDEDIPPEAAWEATIEEHLSGAGAVVVVWTRTSVSSENVKAEARWARQNGKLVQVSLDGAAPPLFFSERQAIDLSRWRGAPGSTYLELEAALRRTIGATEEPATGRGGRPSPPRPGWSSRRRLALAALLAAGAATAVVLAAPGLRSWTAGWAAQDALTCARYLNDAENAMDRERYSRAIQTFEHVIQSCGDPAGRAHLGLSSAYWHLQEYGKALEWGKRGLALVEADPRAEPFDLAMAHKELAYRQLAVGNLQQTIAEHQEVLARLDPSSPEYLYSVYSIGEAELALWRDTEAPALGPHHAEALRRFRAFLDLDGSPQHWAKYHLACLLAGEGGAADGEARVLLMESADAIRRLPEEKKGPIHRRAFRELVLDPDSYFWRPTYPMACPALAGLLARCACRGELEAAVSRF